MKYLTKSEIHLIETSIDKNNVGGKQLDFFIPIKEFKENLHLFKEIPLHIQKHLKSKPADIFEKVNIIEKY